MPEVKTPVGAVAKTHRFDWRPRETLRPAVTDTYMMLSEFGDGRTEGQGDFRSRLSIFVFFFLNVFSPTTATNSKMLMESYC